MWEGPQPQGHDHVELTDLILKVIRILSLLSYFCPVIIHSGLSWLACQSHESSWSSYFHIAASWVTPLPPFPMPLGKLPWAHGEVAQTHDARTRTQTELRNQSISSKNVMQRCWKPDTLAASVCVFSSPPTSELLWNELLLSSDSPTGNKPTSSALRCFWLWAQSHF